MPARTTRPDLEVDVSESRRERKLRERKHEEDAVPGTGQPGSPAADSPDAERGGARRTKRPRRRDREEDVSAVEQSERAIKARNQLTPRWWIVLMVSLMVVGLLWIVVFYLSSARLPVPGWDNWNLAAGFGLVLAGFAMTTRWR